MSHALHAGLDQRMLRRLVHLGLEPQSVLGVAFSGGNDSLALAISLSRCALSRQLKIVLMHVDHGLRPSSSRDAERAVSLAGQLGLPIEVAVLEPGLPQRSAGTGIELQARRERYAALSAMCRAHNAALLATGHHLSDQAESVLLHLFRGTGAEGLTGMQEIGPIPAIDREESHLRLWRPFIGEERQVLTDYVLRSGIKPIDDESNQDPRYRRNAIRHDILPAIERHFPSIQRILARHGEMIADDMNLLNQMAGTWYQNATAASGDVDVTTLLSLPTPIASRIVLRWLRQSGVPEPTRERVEAVLAFAAAEGVNTHIEVGGSHWVIRTGDVLRCGAHEVLMRSLVLEAGCLPLLPEQGIERSVSADFTCHTWSTPDWRVTICQHDSQFDQSEPGLVAAGDGLDISNVIVRRVQAGDVWHHTNAPVRETLRRAGMHPIVRNAVACIAHGNDVIAIPGLAGSAPKRRSDAETLGLTVRWELREANE